MFSGASLFMEGEPRTKEAGPHTKGRELRTKEAELRTKESGSRTKGRELRTKEAEPRTNKH